MCLRNVFSFLKPNKQSIQFKQNEIMKLIIKLLLTLTIVTTLLLGGLNTSKANDLVDENTSALRGDIDNPLCLAYLFQNCYTHSGTCTYHISPNYVCDMAWHTKGVNPN